MARRAEEARKRRNLEANCALDFLVLGDDDGRHAAKCLHEPTCSRDYTPHPPPSRFENEMRTGISVPEDERLYEGTGIGALYGLPGSEAHAWQLAGWNVKAEG